MKHYKTIFSNKLSASNAILACQIISMAVSMLLALIIAYLYPVDQSFWIPLTTFCVCLYISTPLTALRRTIHRILGSIYGVILAGIICLIFTTPSMHLLFLVIFAALTLWSRAFVALYYLFVTFMTASVIMLLAILMRNTDLTPEYLIYERLIFTLIGALISLIVSMSIMPSLERLDMLKTYRHYLSKFILEYKQILTLSKISQDDNYHLLTTRVYQSSQVYTEKLPLWRYALIFNRFIFRGLSRYLHRIHKMRIQNCIIAKSLTTITLSSKPQELLHNNFLVTKSIVANLITLNARKANSKLITLNQINEEFIQYVKNNPKEHNLITIALTLKELQEDLHHLVNGALQLYLSYKYNIKN